MPETVDSPSAEGDPHLSVSSRPELLAPAGDWECAKAAVENGADAIYFGLSRFNARMRAHNFTESDLPGLMEFLHRRGLRGYVTFNTLVFTNELAEAEQYLRSIIAAGVDAAIVQDIGIARLIRRLSPDFPIHASTQMTITSAGGVEFARELGCNLVVLARECSVKDIEAIRRAPNVDGRGPNGPSLPLEVFIHGALCVAYSGQCLTSEALGGRSANRGECAQACRLPYELVSDGKTIALGDRKYLLSPQDLAGLEVLPDLIRSGVASLKIEGRLKSPEYVANITRTYREALDEALAPASPPTLSCNGAAAQPAPFGSRRYSLEMAFSRGLSTGWFRGLNNQELVHARFGKKRGVFLGEVRRVERDRVFVRLQAPLKAGDGVGFDAGRPEETEEGGRVFEIVPVDADGKNVGLTFGHGAVDFSRVRRGDKIWKTSDPELDRRLRQTFTADKPQFQRPIAMEVHGHPEAPLTVIARDELGNVVSGSSTTVLVAAKHRPLSAQKLREQLGRLGGTSFRIGTLKNSLEGEVMLPVSELNRLRREVVAKLETLRSRPPRWTLNECLPEAPTLPRPGERAPASSPELIVMVRSLPQLEAALCSGAQTVYCEFEDPKRYREAVTAVRSAAGGRSPPVQIWVAPPRIARPGEDWILDQVRSCAADGYLIRNYDHLKFFHDCRRRGDFSLNVANPLTAGYFIESCGLERLTASYDLNFEQLTSLVRAAPPEWFEITIHQHMPMFHMEHCVFCAFLSNGTDYRNCGRPCDKHAVSLRDRVGMEHPLKADAGCRNTLFNARAQTGAEYVGRMLDWGLRHFRIEFLNESPEETAQTIAMYRALLRGEVTGSRLWRELKLRNQLGVTRGQMENAGESRTRRA